MRRQALIADPLEITFFQSVIVTGVLLLFVPVIGLPVPPVTNWPWLLLAACLAISSLILLGWAYARAEVTASQSTSLLTFSASV